MAPDAPGSRLPTPEWRWLAAALTIALAFGLALTFVPVFAFAAALVVPLLLYVGVVALLLAVLVLLLWPLVRRFTGRSEASVQCPACRHPQSASASFCADCGARLAA